MLSTYTTFSGGERGICSRSVSLRENPRWALTTHFLLAGGCFKPLSHLSIMGRARIELATRNAAVLQTVTYTLLVSRPMLVVPTGLEPAISCLKDRRLNQFAGAPTTQRLGFEPRTTVLETVVLPLHHLCISGSGGI